MTADPALADVTARYRQADGPPIVIQVNDRGDGRMAVTNAVYLSSSGANHMILTLSSGTIVVRREDFLAVIAELSGVLTPPTPPSRRIAISEHGREVVGGRSGIVYRVGAAGTADFLEFVVSTDADLAPVGRVFQAQFLPMFATQGMTPPGLLEAMTDLLSRGTLLRFGNMLRLEAADTAPVPASAFALPGTPISRDALRERIMSDAGR
jgi:hypothetical protein